MSFAAVDAVHAMKYRDLVDHMTDSWRMTDLIMPGVNDTGWYDHWCSDLRRASGVLIIFTDYYREKADEGRPRNALCMEAAAITKRMARDRGFRLFVLDPNSIGQDYANLRLFLECGVQEINSQLWRSFMSGKPRSDEVIRSTGATLGEPFLRVNRSGNASVTDQPSQLLQYLQVTFAAADEAHANAYRDMVDSYTSSWRMSEAIQPGVAFADWRNDLRHASGVLVIFTDEYQQSANERRRSALRLQAAAIMKRMARDRGFRLFVLDPSCIGQDYANLKLFLEHGVQEINSQLWRDFIAARPSFWWRALLRSDPIHVRPHRIIGGPRDG